MSQDDQQAQPVPERVAGAIEQAVAGLSKLGQTAQPGEQNARSPRRAFGRTTNVAKVRCLSQVERLQIAAKLAEHLDSELSKAEEAGAFVDHTDRDKVLMALVGSGATDVAVSINS